MPKEILNWGLISTARINRVLIPPLKASERNHLLAVASRDAEKAETYAERWSIPESFGRYEEMLADPRIDVVYISLPNSLHAPWAVAAADAGKHVLCEKPLALTVEEVDSIIASGRRNGVHIAEAFMYRHHPQTLQVKDLVEEGAIGDLRMARGSFSFFLSNPGDVRLDPELGGGSIWDIGCYPISYIRTMFGGEPEEVFGQMDPTSQGVDLSFHGQMKFSGNRFGQFDCSFAGPLRSEIEIVGSMGSIYIPNPYKPSVNNRIEIRRDGAGEGSRIEVLPTADQELYIGEVEDLASAILEGEEPLISLQDSRGNVAAIQALLQSAKENRPVGVHVR